MIQTAAQGLVRRSFSAVCAGEDWVVLIELVGK